MLEPDHPPHKDLRAGNVACAVLNKYRKQALHPWDIYPSIERPNPRASRAQIAAKLRMWVMSGMKARTSRGE